MEACQMRGLLYERHKRNDKRQNWIFKNGLNISYDLLFFFYFFLTKLTIFLFLVLINDVFFVLIIV